MTKCAIVDLKRFVMSEVVYSSSGRANYAKVIRLSMIIIMKRQRDLFVFGDPDNL